MTRPRPARLGTGFEPLEARDLPTVFGIPWPDAGHLTLSFVPDGTQTPTGPSTLFKTLDKIASAAVWEQQILRAFQDWAAQTNVNVGVVADGGQPLGTLGAVQGDQRFGDIRIAMAPLDDHSEVAAASPFSWTGTTYGGDVVFDAAAAFQIGNASGGYDLFSVAVHEAGHTLGLDHSTATDSVMQESYGYRAGLGASDVAAIQGMYGARAPDAFDAAKPNNTRATATPIPADPTTPNRFTAAADLTTPTEVDDYKFTVPTLSLLSSVSVRLTAAGQSLLTPTVTVYNQYGMVVGYGMSADPLNNNVTIQFYTGLLGGGTYTVEVGRATSAFGVGSYQLTVDYTTLGAVLTPVTNLLAPVVDGLVGGLLGNALVLTPVSEPVPDARFQYTYRGVISSSTDVDNFKIKAPAAATAGPMNLNVLVWGTGATPVDPRVHIYDAAGNPVAFQVLGNAQGLFSLQVLNATPGAYYYVQVAARNPGGAGGTGAYFLGADFNQMTATAYDPAGGGTVDPTTTVTDTLTMTQAGLFGFALAADAVQAGAGGVTMTVLDATGRVLFTLTATAGQPPVTAVYYLAAGTYTVRYSSPPAGTQAAATRYNLFMLRLNDPVGPYSTTTTSSSPSAPSSMSMAAPSGYTYTSSSGSSPSGYSYSF